MRQESPVRLALAFTIDNPTFGQVVGREFDTHLITRHNPNKVFPHTTGDVSRYEVSSLDFHAKSRVGQRLRHNAFYFQGFFFLFRHLWGSRDFGTANFGTTIIGDRQDTDRNILLSYHLRTPRPGRYVAQSALLRALLFRPNRHLAQIGLDFLHRDRGRR